MSVFYDATSLLNISRQQQQSAKQEVKMLAESYQIMHEEDELDQLINDLIAEGYSEEEIYDYLEERMTDAEKRSLPARTRRRLGVYSPDLSKSGQPLNKNARQTSISSAQSKRKQRREPAELTDRQQRIAKLSSFVGLKKYLTAVPGPSPEAIADILKSSRQSAQQKKTETRKERLQRLEKSGARSRVKARRKGSSGFSPSKETKQQMSASGRYGKRTLGQRIKSLFRKEDIDLFEASVHILINEGYNEEQIAYILETLESGNDDYEIQECLDILENAVDGALIYQFMIENYDFDYHEDVIEAMEQLNEEDIDYILDEGTKIDRRKKGNKYASKYMN